MAFLETFSLCGLPNRSYLFDAIRSKQCGENAWPEVLDPYAPAPLTPPEGTHEYTDDI